jgi:hypothetical protein
LSDFVAAKLFDEERGEGDRSGSATLWWLLSHSLGRLLNARRNREAAGVEVEPIPADCRYLGSTKTTEREKQHWHVEAAPIGKLDQRRRGVHVENFHFLPLYPGRLAEGGRIL